MEDTDIRLAGGIKEHDSKIPWSYQSPNQGFRLRKAEMGFREYFLLFNFNTIHIDKSWGVHSEF